MLHFPDDQIKIKKKLRKRQNKIEALKNLRINIKVRGALESKQMQDTSECPSGNKQSPTF